MRANIPHLVINTLKPVRSSPALLSVKDINEKLPIVTYIQLRSFTHNTHYILLNWISYQDVI